MYKGSFAPADNLLPQKIGKHLTALSAKIKKRGDSIMPSLKSQFKNAYKSMYQHGTSKHGASPEEKQNTIFSTRTRDNYINSSERFVDYLKSNNLKASTMQEAKQYVPDFLQHQIDKGYSAWTIKAQASALGKAYGCSYTEFGVALPTRHNSDISRGRRSVEYDRHFSEEKNFDIVALAKSTGLRRNELQHLKCSDISQDDKGNYIIHVRGLTAKGGRERSVMVYHSDANIFALAKQKIDEAKNNNDEFVCGKVSKAADIHSYRAEYAKSLYEKYARDTDTLERSELYVCRGENTGKVYDRQALDKVTQALGHNRVDVAVTNYLNK